MKTDLSYFTITLTSQVCASSGNIINIGEMVFFNPKCGLYWCKDSTTFIYAQKLGYPTK